MRIQTFATHAAVAAACSVLVAACTEQPELYCNASEACAAGYAYCDLAGVCPASGGVANTCIPEPCWDGGATPADDASMPDAALGVDGGGEPDAGDSPDAAPPPLTTPWGAPVEVAELNHASASDATPTVTEDRVEMIFERLGVSVGGTQRCVAQRFTPTSTWQTPACGGNYEFANAELSRDGLEVFTQVSGPLIRRSIRASRSSAWLSFVAQFDGSGPTLSGDQLTLYYLRDGELRLRTRATVGATWSNEQSFVLPGLPGTPGQIDVSFDDRVLFLVANVGGEYRHYEYRRSSPAAAWDGPHAIAVLDATAGATCSLTDAYEMFCSITDGSQTDIYRLTRP